ncbi:MAG: aldehyde ferredoxin oxidoreductase C-terminal domain-containing protein, partial [Bacillota bacterium]
KLIWNDVVPPDNSKYPPNEATKIPERVEDFQKFYEGMLGEPLDEKKMLRQSERVFNLQRLISYYLGYGTRVDDMPPLRAIGPVTEEEYLSREERYDKQMKEEIGIDPEGKSTGEKLAITREFRYKRYKELLDTVYKKRGWDENGVPTVEHLKELGIDIPEVLALLDRPDY